MDKIIANTGTLSAANLSSGQRLCARVLKVMIRLQLRRLDNTD